MCLQTTTARARATRTTGSKVSERTFFRYLLFNWLTCCSLRFHSLQKTDNFACIMFLSSHPEVIKVTVHPATSPELSNAGAAAHRVAGERTLWVLCGCFSEKETHQELLLPRGHLPIPQGKSRNWVLLLVTSDNFYVGRSKNAESVNCFETKQTSKEIEKKIKSIVSVTIKFLNRRH